MVPKTAQKTATSNTLMIGEHVPTSVEHALTYGAAASPSQAFNEPNADRHEFAMKKVVDATSRTVAPDIDDEVLAFSHDERSNDSIWIDIGAPIMRAFEGSREYVLSPTGARRDRRSAIESASHRIRESLVLPNHFGGCGQHGRKSTSRWGEALISGEEDADHTVPAVETGGWIARCDVTSASLVRERDDALHTETDPASMEGAYSGSYLRTRTW